MSLSKSLLFATSIPICTACLIAATPARAQRTLHIPADSPTIQAAIDSASPGDTLLVAPGTYFENLDLHGKAITLQSTQGTAVTILDGRRLAPTVLFATGETRSTTLSGFTIRNGAPASTSGSHGGGIVLKSASPTILNNVLTSNLCAALDASESAPLLQSNRITLTETGPTCLAQAIAPVVFTGDPASGTLRPTLLDNTIENNDLAGSSLQPNAGAIALLAVRATLLGNTLRFNTTPGDSPGAIQIYAQPGPTGSAPTLLQENLVYGNTTACGAGGVSVSILNSSSDTTPPHLEVQILNNTVADNHSGPQCDGAPGELTLKPGYLPAQVLLANNILAGSTASPALQCASALPAAAFHHNLLHNSAGLVLSTTCADSGANHLADPMFLDRDPAHPDYHLPLHSPAVDAGANGISPTPAQDLDSSPRLQNATGQPQAIIDLGPYEYPAPHVLVPTVTALQTNPGASEAFQPIVLTAQVTANGGAVPSGNVLFTSQKQGITQALGTVPLDPTGHAVFTTSTLPAAGYTIAAAYSGTTSMATSANSVVQQVSPATTLLAFSVTPSSTFDGQTVTLAATVQAHLSSHVPTGQVQFFEIFAAPAKPNPIATGTLDASGHITVPLPVMSAGTHQILAAYSGATDFDPVTLPTTDALTLTISPSAYVVKANTPTLTVQTQHHGSTTLTLASVGNFSGNVTLGCAYLPSPATCTFSPVVVSLTPGKPVQVQLNIETDILPGFVSGFFPVGLLTLLTAPAIRRKRGARLCLVAAASSLTLFMMACGAGTTPAALPPGTYQIQVTSESTSTTLQQTPITLVVTP